MVPAGDRDQGESTRATTRHSYFNKTLDDLREQFENLTQQLESVIKQKGDLEKKITSQTKELEILRQSLSANVCQHCKGKADRSGLSKSILRLLPKMGQSTAKAASSLPESTASTLIGKSGLYSRGSPLSDPSAPVSTPAHGSIPIAAPGRSASPPSHIAARPSISFNSKVKKEIDLNSVHYLKHEKTVHCIRFNRDGRQLAATCGRAIRIYDVSTWNLICVLEDISQKNGDEIYDLNFSIDGIYLTAALDDGRIRVWEISRRHVRNAFKGHKHIIYSLDFSPDGRLLVSASRDGTIRIWLMRDGTSKFLTNHLANGPFYSCAFSPDGMYITAGGSHGLLGIWDVRTRQLVKWLEVHTSTVRSLSYIPGGKGFVTGSWDKTLKYWGTGSLQIRLVRENTATRKDGNFQHCAREDEGMQSLLDFKGHTSYITCVSISPNGRWVASSSDDGSIRIWDVRNAEVQCIVQVHHGHTRSVHFSPVGKFLAYSDWDGHVRIWRCEEV